MILVETEVKNKKWHDEKNICEFFEKICKKIILCTELKKIKNTHTIQINISLVSNQQIKKINYQFRKKNTATNVLSFSNLDENLIRKNGLINVAKPLKYLVLGDIVLAYEYLKKEAILQEKIFYNHLTHMLVHGILHLIGYDHQEDLQAEIMEKLEMKILNKFNIKNPYTKNDL